MNKKWLYNDEEGSQMYLKTDYDDVFGFYTRYQKYEVWYGVRTEEAFMLTLTEVFLHEDS